MSTGYPEQNDARPDDWRQVTRALADLAKRDGSSFASVVREADRLAAAGVQRDDAYRQALASG